MEGREREVMLDQCQSNLVFSSHDLTTCLKQTLCSRSSFPAWVPLTAAAMKKGNLLFGLLLKIPVRVCISHLT